jgi:hypothetical protein
LLINVVTLALSRSVGLGSIGGTVSV